MKEVEILRRLLEAAKRPARPDGAAYIKTSELDKVLLECWGKQYDAGMHFNSMLRRGLIDYEGEGDWLILVTLAEGAQEEASQADCGVDTTPKEE